MPVWDDAKPHGNIPVSQLDNETRDQLIVIKDGLLREHIFPGVFTVDAGIHKAGSARTFVLTATEFGDGSSTSGALATSTGMIVYVSDTGTVQFWSASFTTSKSNCSQRSNHVPLRPPLPSECVCEAFINTCSNPNSLRILPRHCPPVFPRNCPAYCPDA